ncbi:phosphatase PAP2 family protein [bacterium]|nr:phosphatase PAP2 family protein [bacterium]
MGGGALSRVLSTVALMVTITLPFGRGGTARAGDLYELDTGREVALASGTLALGAGLWWLESGRGGPSDERLAALDPSDLPGIDRIATDLWSPSAARWSDVLMIGTGLMPLALLAETGSSMSGGELLVMYVETMAIEQAVVGALKLGAGRLRPFTYNDDRRIPDALRRSAYARRSWPSGHTATAFAGAMFTSEVYARLHPDRPSRHWIRGGSLTLAALTGYLRVRAGNHFPTDVLAGAAIGALIGWAVPALHERDPDPLAPDTAARAAGPRIAFGVAF